MMVHRIFIFVIVLLAILVGFLNISAFHTDAIHLTMFGEFFSAALPILAFGALIKYMCCCNRCSSAGCATCSSSGCKCCKGAGCKCCGDNRKECRPTV
jgi:hypothetical protein